MKIIKWVIVTLLLTWLIQWAIGFVFTVPFQPVFIFVIICRLLKGK